MVMIQMGMVTIWFLITPNVVSNETATDFVYTYGNTCRYFNNKSKNVILAWTSFWFQNYWCDISQNSPEVPRCADKCEITTDRSRLKDSDAIVYHLPDILPWTSMPQSRRPDQVWVLYNLEPPPRQIWYMGGAMWRNVFNWTMSYRQDSTVFVRPYHGYVPLTEAQKRKATQNRVSFLANKNKFAIATISDCNDDAERYKYVYELQKYIDIDIYGKCGTKTCPQWEDECERTIRDYKFHLAFENSYCKDYITEKYWEAHKRKLIPVVNWKTDPENLVFPNSYINIFEFPNMKSVSEYMFSVSTDENLYNSYFDWTKHYAMNCHCGCHWCTLCDKLQDQSEPAQTITDPMAWASDDMCQMFTVGSNNT